MAATLFRVPLSSFFLLPFYLQQQQTTCHLSVSLKCCFLHFVKMVEVHAQSSKKKKTSIFFFFLLVHVHNVDSSLFDPPLFFCFWFCFFFVPGSIINVTSIAAQYWTANQASYCASKAALEAFSTSLSQEVRRFGIHVSTLQPGVIVTPILLKEQGV